MKKQQIVTGALVALMSVAGFALATNMPETPTNSTSTTQKQNNTPRKIIILKPRVIATGSVASGGKVDEGVKLVLPVNTTKKNNLTEAQAEKKFLEKQEKKAEEKKTTATVNDSTQPPKKSLADILRDLMIKKILEKKRLEKKDSGADVYDSSSRSDLK